MVGHKSVECRQEEMVCEGPQEGKGYKMYVKLRVLLRHECGCARVQLIKRSLFNDLILEGG